MEKDAIEIPFRTRDSELKGWEYTIPEGMEAEIKNGKIVLKEKESEDERIIRAINNMLPFIPDEAYSNNWVTKESILSWLEKQKERGHLSKNEEYTLARIIEYLEDNDCPSEWKDLLHDVYSLPYQKEQNPLSTEETKLNSIAFLEQMGYTCIPPVKEQKHKRERKKPKESWLEKSKYELAHEEELLIKRQKELSEIRASKDKEQQPTEWSDSVAKEMFIKALERAVEQTKKGYELTDCDKHSWWEDFKAYSGIKPAEWSEEDEEMIARICANLEYLTKEAGCDSELKEKLEERIKWMQRLKSLRPQQKREWTESELNAFANCYILIGAADDSFEKSFKDKCIHFLMDLQDNAFISKSHWKPREEQMSSLYNTIIQTKGYSYSMYLPELYEELKKL